MSGIDRAIGRGMKTSVLSAAEGRRGRGLLAGRRPSRPQGSLDVDRRLVRRNSVSAAAGDVVLLRWSDHRVRPLVRSWVGSHERYQYLGGLGTGNRLRRCYGARGLSAAAARERIPVDARGPVVTGGRREGGEPIAAALAGGGAQLGLPRRAKAMKDGMNTAKVRSVGGRSVPTVDHEGEDVGGTVRGTGQDYVTSEHLDDRVVRMTLKRS